MVCTCRLELQDSKQNNYENTSSPTTVKLSQLDESKEPAYDVVDTSSGTQDVKMTSNPAYDTINMDENPAYK